MLQQVSDSLARKVFISNFKFHSNLETFCHEAQQIPNRYQESVKN